METLDDLIRLHGMDWIQRHIDIRWPRSQKEFIKRLEDIVDQAVRRAEEDADLLHDACEELISRYVVRQLERAGYQASCETNHRGHVDMLVRSIDPEYTWLCESKIHRKYDDLIEALNQLTTRYSTGRDRDAGIMIVIRAKACNRVISSWRTRLVDHTDHKIATIDKRAQNRGFRSSHVLPSGSKLRVRHFALHMYFEPQDRSGTNSTSRTRKVADD